MSADLPILWFDLETCGIAPLAPVLEIGACLTGSDLRFIGSPFEALIKVAAPIYIEPEARAMHESSGLLNDLYDAEDLPDILEAEGIFMFWLNAHVGTKTELVLAGSGINFDRRYIEAYWPRLAKRLTFWGYDVGVVRRTFRLAGFELHRLEPVPHRALPDVYHHIEEMRGYVGAIRSDLVAHG